MLALGKKPRLANCEAFLDHLQRGGDQPAIFYADKPTSYRELCNRVAQDRSLLKSRGISGSVVLFVSEFSPRNISLLIALWLESNVVALSSSREEKRTETLAQSSGASFVLTVTDEERVDIAAQRANHLPANVATLLKTRDPGLVVFSSGTTGPAKGVVHRLTPFFDRHKDDPDVGTMLAFMSFDHIGGMATLFQVLFTHGAVAIPKERSPQELGRCVEALAVNTLHVSPTLLNLVLISGVFEGRHIASLKHIYFGSEPISPAVLQRVQEQLPKVRLTQLYGMSETGVLPCINKHNDNTWLRIEKPGYGVEVIDGICHIHSQTLMVGYLSDASAVSRDEPFCSGDLGEAENGYFRIKGRKVHLINVGGTNVSPVDVELQIEKCANIADVVVTGVPNPILGEVVSARVVLDHPEPLNELKLRLFHELKGQLAREEIPTVITISDTPLYSERFKKTR